MGISKKLYKLRLGFSRDRDGDVVLKGRLVQDKTFGNPAFPKTPVTFEDFKDGLDRFEALIAEAIHGDRRIVAEKNRVREEVVNHLELVGAYVQFVAGEDFAAITSSGYELLETSYAAPKPLDQPGIQGVKQGKSGELQVLFKTVGRDVKYYELRHGPQDDDGVVKTWTEKTIPSGTGVRSGVWITGLTPGTIYAFQVRAQGKLGMTDWSDPFTKMCT